jgi:hypothetical protein
MKKWQMLVVWILSITAVVFVIQKIADTSVQNTKAKTDVQVVKQQERTKRAEGWQDLVNLPQLLFGKRKQEN